MSQLINCHYKYLMSKTTLISLLIMLVVILCGYMISIDDSFNYCYQVFFITKFLFILVVCFNSSYNIILKNDQYVYLVLASGYKRSDYIISKIIVLLIFYTILMLLLVVMFLLIGEMLVKNFYLDINYLILFMKIYLVAIIYSLYSLLLSQIINNIFSSILVFTTMLISDIVIEDQMGSFVKLVYLIFPNIAFTNQTLLFGYGHLLFMIMILFSINTIVYLHKDL